MNSSQTANSQISAPSRARAPLTAAQYLQHVFGFGNHPARRGRPWAGPDRKGEARLTEEITAHGHAAFTVALGSAPKNAGKAKFTPSQVDMMQHLYAGGPTSYGDITTALPHVKFPHQTGGYLADHGLLQKVKHPETGKAAFQMTDAGKEALATHMGWTGAPAQAGTPAHTGQAPNSGEHKEVGGTAKKPGEAYHFAPGAAASPAKSSPATTDPAPPKKLSADHAALLQHLAGSGPMGMSDMEQHHPFSAAVAPAVHADHLTSSPSSSGKVMYGLSEAGKKALAAHKGLAGSGSAPASAPGEPLPEGWKPISTKADKGYKAEHGGATANVKHLGGSSWAVYTKDARDEMTDHGIVGKTKEEAFAKADALLGKLHQPPAAPAAHVPLPAEHVTLGGQKHRLSTAPTTQADLDAMKDSPHCLLSEKAKASLQAAFDAGSLPTRSALHQVLAIAEAVKKTTPYAHVTATSLAEALAYGTVANLSRTAAAGDAEAQHYLAHLGPTSSVPNQKPPPASPTATAATSGAQGMPSHALQSLQGPSFLAGGYSTNASDWNPAAPFTKYRTEITEGKHGAAVKALFSKLFAGQGIKEALAAVVGKWTGSSSGSVWHQAWPDALAGKANAHANNAAKVLQTRRTRWKKLCEEKEMPFPDTFHVYRGMSGDGTDADTHVVPWVIAAWRSEEPYMHVKSKAASSWSMSQEKAESFSGLHTGVVFETHVPFEQTIADMFVDDMDFLSSFPHENEVVCGGKADSLVCPKDSVTVYYEGKKYGHAQRHLLFAAYKKKHGSLPAVKDFGIDLAAHQAKLHGKSGAVALSEGRGKRRGNTMDDEPQTQEEMQTQSQFIRRLNARIAGFQARVGKAGVLPAPTVGVKPIGSFAEDFPDQHQADDEPQSE